MKDDKETRILFRPIAEALQRSRPTPPDPRHASERACREAGVIRDVVDALASEIADALSGLDPRFDAAKFRAIARGL